MKKYFFIMIFLSQVLGNAQTNSALLDTQLVYEDQEQLEELYAAYQQSMLIIEDKIYYLPCECSPCRNFGGKYGGRNSGGDIEGRNQAGDASGRNLGGGGESRNQSGDSEERRLGGDISRRNMGGDDAGRNTGGESESRDFGGDNENRNLGGDAEGRHGAGDAEDRNLGGDNQDRRFGAGAQGRNTSGVVSDFTCEKISGVEFHLGNINRNANIYFYDGVSLEKVKIKKGVIKTD